MADNDLSDSPVGADSDVTDPAPRFDSAITSAAGVQYRIRATRRDLSSRELRWTRSESTADGAGAEAVTLRVVIAAFEDYEPMRTMSADAIVAHRQSGAVSVAALAHELKTLERTRIVLNRGLREAVLDATKSGRLTMSEIAIRCGRVKRDARGNVAGETSWLARRVGIMPEGGGDSPTPWVHTETLALIARDGLGIAPGDAEL